MRPIFTFLLLCLVSLSLNAQLIEVPILGNPVLKEYSSRHFPISLRSGSDAPTTFVAAGGSSVVCIDTTDFNIDGFFANATCTNCTAANFGTADLSGLCITYDANAGVNQVSDDICIEVCSDSGDCAQMTYPFEIRSAFQLSTNNPFFDDFSYDGPYPDESMWLDRDVFVNNTLANNPPSVGFASFDGIDYTGTPYGGGYGLSDQLTTNFIDLSAFGQGSSVHLSFHVQEKGFGIGPLAGDSLVVQGRFANGTWNTIEIFEPAGLGNTVPDGFFPISRTLTDPNYFHSGFQLRFINYSRRQGAIELWHVDYVAISATPLLNGLYDDIAFVNVPTPFLSTYTAMPWRHFENNVVDEITSTYFIDLVNHFENENDVQNTTQNITELTTGTEVAEFVLLSGNQFNIPETGTSNFTASIPAGVEASMINSLESNFPGATDLVFETTYAYNVGSEQVSVTGVLRNDTVRSRTNFSNYFAYDDGSAEAALVAPNTGDRIAVKYTANVGDSLRAVQFHFPRIQNGTETQLFNMQVYIGELDNDPEYELIFQTPFFVDTELDSLQGFTNYSLLDFSGTPEPLFIPAGDFYVGWQQVTNTDNAIPIGLDKNNLDASQYGFYSPASEWVPVGPGGLVDGAIMVRPVFGDFTPINTPVNEIARQEEEISIYPNPANQFINVENVDFNNGAVNYQILNASGQVLKTGILDGTIHTSDLLNGMYFLSLDDPIKGKSTIRFLVVK